ncbi:MAG: putative virulence factor [Rhodospirillum sp.]|nr:putative virulence factor [Rhodospirillum sp.]MCF8490237.1 putative virulence factor [Rhodospirillum sp.]MCF8503189.1 putative virulence factor [Rhodospirillum sp.]
MSVREKDSALGRACDTYRQTAYAAIEWINANERLVGPALPGLERSLKSKAMEGRRLANAAVRPMSVAVFGPSQAGKSFLVGKFITPNGKPAKVLFGEGDECVSKDFLSEVNPQGGRETTGLVTRFSLTPESAPPGHPVHLRLMGEVDVAKILVNSFVFDLTHTYGDPSMLDQIKVAERIDALEKRAGETPLPGMSMEDVLDLREYLTDNLKKHPYVTNTTLRDLYWPSMETLLPRLDTEGRLAALTLLWGGLKPLDSLYRRMKTALDSMQHTRIVHAPLSVIEDTTNGVLHVNRIYELDKPGSPGSHVVTVLLEDGGRTSLPQADITALTSELRVALDEAPWPFLEHTDLLDFPGARAREDSVPDKVFGGNDGGVLAKAHCFLRGKVAVLFDNYVADLDVNSMLLCLPDSNLEVRKLPDLVAGWVERTHGEDPTERKDRPTTLFFCMTKSDRLFNLSRGGSPSQAVENRMEVNIKEFTGWMEEWHPGRPFDNTYMLRNPNAGEVSDIFAYEGESQPGVVRLEEGLNPDFEKNTLPAYAKAMEENKLARSHIARTQDKWDSMLALNDGGVTLLANDLAPVCDPDLKFSQIDPRARRLRVDLRSVLTPYFVDNDIQTRVAERMNKAKAAFIHLQQSRSGSALGLFIQTLTVKEDTIRGAFLTYARRDQGDPGADGPVAATPAGGGSSNLFGFDLDSLDLGLPSQDPAPERAPPPKKKKEKAKRFGDFALSRWLDSLHDKARDESTLSAIGMTGTHFMTIVNELEAGCRRFNLAARMDERTDRVVALHMDPTMSATTIGLECSLIINEFVHDLGRREMTESPEPQWAERARALTTKPPAPKVGEFPTLPAKAEDIEAARNRNPRVWIQSFFNMTQESAASNEGLLVDPEQNAKLGALLARLED